MIVICLINVIMSIPPNKIVYDRANVMGKVAAIDNKLNLYLVDFSVAAEQHKYIGDYSAVVVNQSVCRSL
jgi:hypothetical protein